MSEVNRVFTLVARPVGFPRETDFELIEEPKPTPGDGQFLVRTKFVSVDPYMRGRMNEQRSYADPFEIGKVIYGGAVGEIVESDHDRYQVGGFVHGMWGWQDYAVCEGTEVYPVDPNLAPIQTSIGVLGRAFLAHTSRALYWTPRAHRNPIKLYEAPGSIQLRK